MRLSIKIPDARRGPGHNNIFIEVKSEDEATAYVKNKEKYLRSKEYVHIMFFGREGANKDEWAFFSVDEFLNRSIF